MSLRTDDQTIEDLRIFGKRDANGIYDIYNHAHTRGGELLLDHMFRHPLADADQINRRSNIIRQFAQLHGKFPFEVTLFDVVEKYLASGEQQQGHTSPGAKLGEKDINNGVVAVIELLQQAHAFTTDNTIAAVEAYASERAAMAVLLSNPAIAPALRETQIKRLSFGAVTAYDQLFRTQERALVTKLLAYLYGLDVYMSVAMVANKRQLIFPRALPKGSCHLVLEGVYHPGLTNPVGNRVTISAERNVIFLTGANMAGKSTILRAMSTALYVAHMGFPVAATAMEFNVLDGIFTTINLPDNLGIGASHFYAEVLRVKTIANELKGGKSLLVIFDELFRGTNVKDAHEATVAVTAAFARKKNSMFVISSHIVEAGEDLGKVPGVAFHYMPTRMNGHTPEYTYTMEAGITDDRHGMLIIRNEGILDILKHGRKPAKASDVNKNIAKKEISSHEF